MSIVEQKPVTKSKTSKYNITIKSTEDKKEYYRQLYQLKKEKKQKESTPLPKGDIYENQPLIAEQKIEKKQKESTPLPKKDAYGKPILTAEQKIEKQKEYMKKYREENKEKIAQYDSRKYIYDSEKVQKINKKTKLNTVLLNVFKELYYNNLLDIKDEDKRKILQQMLS